MSEIEKATQPLKHSKKWKILPRDEWPKWVINLICGKSRRKWNGKVIKGTYFLYRITMPAHEAPSTLKLLKEKKDKAGRNTSYWYFGNMN